MAVLSDAPAISDPRISAVELSAPNVSVISLGLLSTRGRFVEDFWPFLFFATCVALYVRLVVYDPKWWDCRTLTTRKLEEGGVFAFHAEKALRDQLARWLEKRTTVSQWSRSAQNHCEINAAVASAIKNLHQRNQACLRDFTRGGSLPRRCQWLNKRYPQNRFIRKHAGRTEWTEWTE